MRVVIIGNGGREHALVDAVSKSLLVNEVICIPGNYGISKDSKVVNIDIHNNEEIVKFCCEEVIDLVIIGPENVLFNGLSDELIKHNIKVLGPTKKASRIEASKLYAKELMEEYNIPTAKYVNICDMNEVHEYLKTNNMYPIVIKYDGLAAGKGVYIVKDKNEAKKIFTEILEDKLFGDSSVVVEEFLEGDEFTVLSLVNEDKVYPFQAARDFKKIGDNDMGLNTGGMGAICPYRNVDEETYKQAVEILEKTAYALTIENNSFSGVLYGGFIKTNDGVKVIEYNARFGDPETQCVLNNLESDLVQNILDLLEKKDVVLKFNDKTSVGIVLSAPGYPSEYEKEVVLDQYLKLPYKIYHMQTKLNKDSVVSNGGRVLFVLNEGSASKEAFLEIYESLLSIKKQSLHYRKDLFKY